MAGFVDDPAYSRLSGEKLPAPLRVDGLRIATRIVHSKLSIRLLEEDVVFASTTWVVRPTRSQIRRHDRHPLGNRDRFQARSDELRTPIGKMLTIYWIAARETMVFDVLKNGVARIGGVRVCSCHENSRVE